MFLKFAAVKSQAKNTFQFTFEKVTISVVANAFAVAIETIQAIGKLVIYTFQMRQIQGSLGRERKEIKRGKVKVTEKANFNSPNSREQQQQQ